MDDILFNDLLNKESSLIETILTTYVLTTSNGYMQLPDYYNECTCIKHSKSIECEFSTLIPIDGSGAKTIVFTMGVNRELVNDHVTVECK